jgi:hypothetical protein
MAGTKNIGIGRHPKSRPRRPRATQPEADHGALRGAPRASGPEFLKHAAGTILEEKISGPGPARHAPGPIRAGIAGSYPDLIPGPASSDEQPLSRCSASDPKWRTQPTRYPSPAKGGGPEPAPGLNRRQPLRPGALDTRGAKVPATSSRRRPGIYRAASLKDDTRLCGSLTEPDRRGCGAMELGVCYVLEGRVRRSGNHLRVNAQLIDAINAHFSSHGMIAGSWASPVARPVNGIAARSGLLTLATRNGL